MAIRWRAVGFGVVGVLAVSLLAAVPTTVSAASAVKSRISVTVTGPGVSSWEDLRPEVRLQRKTSRGWTTLVRHPYDESDDPLTFRFRFERDGTFRVRVRPERGAFRTSFSRPFHARAGQQHTTRVRMRPGAGIKVTVTGEQQGPSSGRTLQLWRKQGKKWVLFDRALADWSPYVFPVKPGRYRVEYRQRNGWMWAPRPKPVTIKGRKQVAEFSLHRRHSKSISGRLNRVGIDESLAVRADVKRGGKWVKVRSNAVGFDGDTYTVPVPGARPKARVRVQSTWYPDPGSPEIFWDGSAKGVLKEKRAATIDLAGGSVDGIDFTVPVNREFVTVAAPKIVGRAKVGGLLRVTKGTWSPRPQKVTYQWERGGLPIWGVTGRTYRVRERDRGFRITVRVTIERNWYRWVEFRSRVRIR